MAEPALNSYSYANKEARRMKFPSSFSLSLSLLSDSNQRPRDYKSRALAN